MFGNDTIGSQIYLFFAELGLWVFCLVSYQFIYPIVKKWTQWLLLNIIMRFARHVINIFMMRKILFSCPYVVFFPLPLKCHHRPSKIGNNFVRPQIGSIHLLFYWWKFISPLKRPNKNRKIKSCEIIAWKLSLEGCLWKLKSGDRFVWVSSRSSILSTVWWGGNIFII